MAKKKKKCEPVVKPTTEKNTNPTPPSDPPGGKNP